MACQAIVAYFLLLVAPHAPAHGHVNKGSDGRLFTLGDASVTGLTFDLRKDDMDLVGIEDVIRLSIDSPPGDLFSSFRELPDLFLFGTFRHRFFVTFQADRDVRHSREALGLIIFVAGVTFEPLIDMLFVIEGDGLVGLRPCGMGTDEEEDEDNSYC